jgi:hypothetical protein
MILSGSIPNPKVSSLTEIISTRGLLHSSFAGWLLGFIDCVCIQEIWFIIPLNIKRVIVLKKQTF